MDKDANMMKWIADNQGNNEFWDNEVDDDEIDSDIDANNDETFDNAAEWNQDEHEEMIARDSILSQTRTRPRNNHASSNNNNANINSNNNNNNNSNISHTSNNNEDSNFERQIMQHLLQQQQQQQHVLQRQLMQHHVMQQQQQALHQQRQQQHALQQQQQQFVLQQQQRQQYLLQQQQHALQQQQQQYAIQRQQQNSDQNAPLISAPARRIFTVDELESQLRNTSIDQKPQQQPSSPLQPQQQQSSSMLHLQRSQQSQQSQKPPKQQQQPQQSKQQQHSQPSKQQQQPVNQSASSRRPGWSPFESVFFIRTEEQAVDHYKQTKKSNQQRYQARERPAREFGHKRDYPSSTIIPPQVQLSVINKARRLHSITTMHPDEYIQDKMPTFDGGFHFKRHSNVKNETSHHDGVLTEKERSWLTRIQEKIQADYDDNLDQDYYYLMYFNRSSMTAQKSCGPGVLDKRFIPRERLCNQGV